MMEPRDGSVVSCEGSTNMSQLFQLLLEEDITHQSLDHISLRNHGSQAASHIWRERVTQWCYEVVDHLRGSRSTVYVAMNILDRYLLHCPQTTSDRSYEAAALTALFLAVSICDSRSLEVLDLVRMSRLGVTIREIVNVGKDMTRALSFDRRLLTPTHFVQYLVAYLPTSWTSERISQITDTADFHTELCTVDSFFSGVKASDIAFASILAALDSDASAFARTVTSSTARGQFDSCQVRGLCERIKKLRRGTPDLEEPHIIPDSGDVCDLAVPSSITRIVSSPTMSLKRSDGIAELVALDVSCPEQPFHKRPVSPVTVHKSKRQRFV